MSDKDCDNGYKRGLSKALEILREESSKPCNCHTCACDIAIERIKKAREEI